MKKINASDLIELDDPFIDGIVKRVCEELKVKQVGETYSTKEVAEKIGVNEQTIRRHIREGLLKATQNGKSYIITEQNLKKYIS